MNALTEVDNIIKNFITSPASGNQQRLQAEFIHISQQFDGILEGYNHMLRLLNEPTITREMLHLINYGGGIDNFQELAAKGSSLNKFRLKRLKGVDEEFNRFMRKVIFSIRL